MVSRILLVALSLSVAATTVNAQTSQRWWKDVTALSHDSMAGRQTGSAEHRKAAEYVARAFAGAGLAPAGTDGFFQPVRFLSRTVDESKSSLSLVREGREERLSLGEDAAFVLRAPMAASVDAPVVFAGYGLQLPEYGIDDLAGLDVKGKIVAYSTAMPRNIPGPVVSHSRAQAWETFRRAGAVGMLTLTGSVADDRAFIRTSANRLSPQMTLRDGALDSQRGNTLSVSFNAARAEKLFAGAPQRYAAIVAAADSGLPLPRFELPVRLRSRVQLITRDVTSDNVVGVLRGSDPALRDEYVVVSAHLDHVGFGRAVSGDSLYNGAMDNASGTALLMETARRLHESGVPLKRSLLFVAVTAEEKGLLGSRYFANHPTVPASRIVADLNTDMFMPIIPLTMVMVNGLEESDLADDARRAGLASGVAVVTDPEPEENRFIRSDQYSFILRGIPSLSFKVGFARGTPEHEAVKEFRARRYHLPQDDITQPVDQDAAEGFTRFYVNVLREVANRASRPAWNETSFFRRLGGPT
ncbi:MAG: M28 family peptidase [Gemmatimonadaceae bacterium]